MPERAGYRRIRLERWGGEHDHSTHWNYRVKAGRVQVQLTVMRHRYPMSPDRWVVQPHLIVDRKNGRGWHGERAA